MIYNQNRKYSMIYEFTSDTVFNILFARLETIKYDLGRSECPCDPAIMTIIGRNILNIRTQRLQSGILF